ncbi:MAG: response regulator, partial [Candidatus Coatesbacteria bacterium]|nr:response regulator [Candidatus Coatesbacteria bacterium]
QDGPEAISKATTTRFDIIFMDIRMPLLNGVEAYRKIRCKNPGVPIIMMTAYSMEELVEEAIQMGAFAVIHKPLDMTEVEALIERVRARKKASVLFVDDDQVLCDNMQERLSIAGYEADTALSGESAVEACRKKAYEVACIDCKLPQMDGFETFIAIKNIQPQIAAIMITGYREEMKELIERAISNCAYSCLYKPFEAVELLRLIKEACGESQSPYRPKGIFNARKREYTDR